MKDKYLAPLDLLGLRHFIKISDDAGVLLHESGKTVTIRIGEKMVRRNFLTKAQANAFFLKALKVMGYEWGVHCRNCHRTFRHEDIEGTPDEPFICPRCGETHDFEETRIPMRVHNRDVECSEVIK